MREHAATVDGIARLPQGLIHCGDGEVWWVPVSEAAHGIEAIDLVLGVAPDFDPDDLGYRKVWMRRPHADEPTEDEWVETDPITDALPCRRFWRVEHGIGDDDGQPVPVTDRPCKHCGFVLRFAPLGTGVVQDTSMRGVPGGPYPEFVPGDRTVCLRCITGAEVPDA